MEKYGVVLDSEKVKKAEASDDKTKTATEGSAIPSCPVCLKELDDAGACPEHGTEPLEPTGGGEGGEAA